MSNEVRVRVVAEDKASKEFNAITANANKMSGAIKASLAGAALAGVASFTAGLGSAFKAAQENARVNEQLAAVLRSTGGAAGVSAKQAQDLASEMQRLTRYEDEAVLGAENILLTFTKIKGNIFPETTKAVLDMSTAMGQDLKTSAIQIGKALQDPIAGMTALRRVGVAFTESQQEQIKTLVESGHLFEAQKLILAELKKEFGGSAEAMTPFEERMEKIKDFTNEAKESIGFFIIGGLDKLSGWFEAHADDFKRFFEGLGGVFEALKRQAGTHLAGVINTMKGVAEAVQSLADLISDVAHGRWADAWQSLKNVATAIAKSLVSAVAALFGQIPNLLISAINEAISKVNSVQLPDKIFGVDVPGGGGGLNLPTLPKIPLPTVDFNDFAEAIKGVGEAAVSSKGKHLALGEAEDEAGNSASKLADKLKDFTSSISGAISDLMSQPTREQLELDLQLAQFDKGAKDRVKQLSGGIEFSTNPATQAMMKRAQDQVAQEREQLQGRIQDLQNEHRIMELRLQLANNLLITEGQLRERFVILRDIVGNATRGIASTATLIEGAFRESINKIIAAANELKGGAAGNSHAGGLDYVPYDNYKANLHMGERVLTAKQNRDWFPKYEDWARSQGLSDITNAGEMTTVQKYGKAMAAASSGNRITQIFGNVIIQATAGPGGWEGALAGGFS